LDKYKYASRYDDIDGTEQRDIAAAYLMRLNDMLADTAYLCGDAPTLADMGTVTFVRQYANVDRTWFDAQPWPHLLRWLVEFLESDRFAAIMEKHKPWAEGDPITLFPK
jgi:glutathione S-transferase